GVTLLSCESQNMIKCAANNAKPTASKPRLCSSSVSTKSAGTSDSISFAVSSAIGALRSSSLSGAASMKIAFACSGNCPETINSKSWFSAINLYKAGADKVPRTIYAAVTGKPIPKTNDAKAINTSMMNKSPFAQPLIIKEKVLPMPVVLITLITKPIPTSRTAVVAIFFAP
ncbi:hypothetical protein D049_1820B, partial [Vibrio parahaemolyticus VPTS-2010]